MDGQQNTTTAKLAEQNLEAIKKHSPARLFPLKLSGETLDGEQLTYFESKYLRFPERNSYGSALLGELENSNASLSDLAGGLHGKDLEALVDNVVNAWNFPNNLIEPQQIPLHVLQSAYQGAMSQAIDLVEQRAVENYFSEAAASKARLMAGEVLTDHFRHGNKFDPTKSVELWVIYQRGTGNHELLFISSDEAIQQIDVQKLMKRLKYIDNGNSGNGKFVPIGEGGGMGLWLVRKVSDHSLFEANPNGNYFLSAINEPLPADYHNIVPAGKSLNWSTILEGKLGPYPSSMGLVEAVPGKPGYVIISGHN